MFMDTGNTKLEIVIFIAAMPSRCINLVKLIINCRNQNYLSMILFHHAWTV